MPRWERVVRAVTPVPDAGKRLLIVSMDGLRPDLLIRARTPNLRKLIEEGSFTFWARTTPHAITLPSHVSMLTGVVPRRHEIEWNKDLPLREPVYPAVPTLFEVAKKAGYTTALVAGKSKFDTLNRPGTIDWFSVPSQTKCDDEDVVRAASSIIREHQPQVMFIHLPGIDNVGHAKGWGTAEQLTAVEGADAALGAILLTLDETKLRDQTTLIVTADHGGAGHTHLADDFRARHIPWIITGPGVRKNLDLTTFPTLAVNIEDTFATACSVMGLSPALPIDGKPIEEAFGRTRAPHELMSSFDSPASPASTQPAASAAFSK